MVKFKAKTKDCQLKVRAKLSYDETVDFTELDTFSRKLFRGFLCAKQVKSRIIEYTGPIGISLYERLKKPITKYDFFFIIAQIIDSTQKVHNNNFSLKNVVWNTNYVYINEATKQVQLIYLPSLSSSSNADIISFLESIIYFCKPIVEPDTDYASRFLCFIRNLRSFDPNMIENYIMREERKAINTIKKHTIGSSGFMTDKQRDYLEHYEEDERTGLLVEDDATNVLGEDDEATGLLGEEATGLLEDENATALLIEDTTIHYPTLFRVLTNETIQINKPVFRLGKERSFVDYFVSNNNAVSRSHADIITRGQRYFVIDLNSKNRTFINGQPIAAQTECEILNGNQLRLANEEFLFYV